MAAPNECASTSGSTCYPQYDVFLNHRGIDVKNTFVSHLYRRLISCGLRVFLDREQMGKGYAITPQIEAAIQVAHFHIAIFSENYAESRWCLDELVLMLKSRATILPIFFNVEPSQLRWVGEDDDGWYAEALRDHQRNQRHDFKTIQTWRKSLSCVAGISGFELKKYNGYYSAMGCVSPMEISG